MTIMKVGLRPIKSLQRDKNRPDTALAKKNKLDARPISPSLTPSSSAIAGSAGVTMDAPSWNERTPIIRTPTRSTMLPW